MGRIPAIDTLRVFAILAVLTLHARLFRAGEDLAGWERTAEIVLDHASRFAVPFFFFVVGFLFERGRGDTPPLDRAIPQVKRLLLLYFGWSLVLVGLEWVRRSVWAGGFAPVSWPDEATVKDTLSFGVRMHLWFLPALMQSLLVYAALAETRLIGPVAIALYAVGLATGTYAPVTGLDLGLWSRNGPFFGTLFVWAGAVSARRAPPPLVAAFGMIVAGAALHAAELVWLHESHGQEWLHERINYLAGTALAGVGVGWLALARPTLGARTVLPACGAYTLGVYILHLDVMQWLAETVPFTGIAGQMGLVLVTYAVTLGVVRVIAAWRGGRKWVG